MIGRDTDRIPGKGVFKPDDRADISGADHLQVLPVVGVHLEQPPHPFPVSPGYVLYRRSGFYLAGIYAEEYQAAHEGICRHFECQSGQRFIFIGIPKHCLFGPGVDALYRRNVRRGRQIINDRV